MKKVILCSLCVVFLLSASAFAGTSSQELEAQGFVDVKDVIPDIVLDIRYATTDNFTGEVVYPCARCYLRKEVAERLAKVQELARQLGLGLKIYDGYRPYRVQARFWELVPDERYVAKPKMENGKIVIGSRHNRGAAVDVTLVDENGDELEMPTGFDDFTPKAKPDYAGGSEQSRANRDLLIRVMSSQGFTPYPTEWWHYDAPDWEQFEMVDLPLCDQ